MRSEVGKDLARSAARPPSSWKSKVAAEDQLRRVDIRAPQAGVVHQSTVHTIGGVITPAEVIMLIVPECRTRSTVEAKIQPQDIDKIAVGQKTVLRFRAFNQRTTPELNGEVSRISADVTKDQSTGPSYYTIRVSVPPKEVARLGEDSRSSPACRSKPSSKPASAP